MNNYIHCIDLNNPVTCLNIVETKQLCSYKALLNSFTFLSKDITEFPIADMYERFHNAEVGLQSPRGVLIWQGSLIRSGNYLAFGLNKQKILDPKFYSKILKNSAAEIQFEKIRREINPYLPSRLAAIFIAEDTLESRIHLSSMLSHLTRPYVIDVSIKQNIKIFKADSRFFDEYIKTENRKLIEKYWRGEKFTTCDRYNWEYIFEGVLEIENEEDLKYIKLHGVFEAPEKE